jgi:hypothetical protein
MLVKINFLKYSGTHHKGLNCDPNEKVKNLNEIKSKEYSNFFPKELIKSYESKLFFRLRKSNGGWSDIRDHMLCKSFISYDESSKEEEKNNHVIITSRV